MSFGTVLPPPRDCRLVTPKPTPHGNNDDTSFRSALKAFSHQGLLLCACCIVRWPTLCREIGQYRTQENMLPYLCCAGSLGVKRPKAPFTPTKAIAGKFAFCPVSPVQKHGRWPTQQAQRGNSITASLGVKRPSRHVYSRATIGTEHQKTSCPPDSQWVPV